MTDELGAASRPRSAGWLTWAIPLAVALWAVLCFSPAFEADFLNWDDDANIVDNSEFRGLGGQQLTWMFTRAHGGPYMPLTWLSLAVDHALFGLSEGFDPPEASAFHAVNVGLHALAALLFCGLARRVFAAAGAEPHGRATVLAAGFAAALFAVHPLRVESVAWMTERRDVLSGVFFVLAISAYLRATPAQRAPRFARAPAGLTLVAGASAVALFFASVDLGGEELSFRAPGLLGPVGLTVALAALGLATLAAPRAAASFPPGEGSATRARAFALSIFWLVLAFLSKALGVALPLVLLCVDVWPLRRWRRGDGVGPAAALLVEKTPFFVLSLIFGLLAIWGQASAVHAYVSFEHHPMPQRLAQAVYGLWFYPTRTLVPVGLIPLVELPPHDWIRSARFLVPAAGALATAIAAFLLRRRVPALAVSSVAFTLLIAPVLGLSQAGAHLVADRYSYLPCAPFALLIAGGWLAAVRRRPVPAALAALAAVLALGGSTYRLTGFWRDTPTLWNHQLDVVPGSVRPHYMLARMHYRDAQESGDRGKLPLARAEFERGIAKDGQLSPYYHGIYGALLIDLGEYGEAAGALRQVVDSGSEDAVTLTNLGVALRLLERPRLALEYGERAVRVDPDYTKGWWNLALIREALGDRAGAAAACREVLDDWPRYGAAKRKLAELQP